MTPLQRRAARDWSPRDARVAEALGTDGPTIHRDTVHTTAGVVPVVIAETAGADGATFTIYALDADGAPRVLYPTPGETVWMANLDGSNVRAVEPWLPAGATRTQAVNLACGILHGTAALFLDALALFGTAAARTPPVLPHGDGAPSAAGDAPTLRIVGPTTDRPARVGRAATERAEAPNPREGMRRLLNARCTTWGKHVGTIGTFAVEPRDCADRMRHEAIREATGGRTQSSMDRSVTEAEMADAVTYVEHWLHETGYDLDADDAAYAARRAAREAA